MNTKKEIFGLELKVYLKATKEEKKDILTALERQTTMHRKSIIRALRRKQMEKPERYEERGRPLYYTPDVTAALYDIWIAASEICGELIHPIIPEYVRILRRDNQWNHSDLATGKLLSMSEGTTKKRVLEFMRQKRPGKGKSTTSPSSMKGMIPVFCGPWNSVPVGHGQIDTVVHCGSTLAGDMVFSLSYTDVHSGWWEGRGQWNKGMEATRNGLKDIQENLPIPWFHAHPDCGSEFLNRFVITWAQENEMRFTRSRAYHKNDNAYVEQKNGHIIRKTFGYSRLDTPKVLPLMNKVYSRASLHRNYFIPQRKLISKERHGARHKKKYDQAKTPFERVLADDSVSAKVKENLTLIREKLNPLDLKNQIDTLINDLWKIQRSEGSR